MAKLNARGAHKVASVQYDLPMRPNEDVRITDSYITLTLRSDGKLLEKITHVYRNTSIGTYSNASGYRIDGTLKAGVPRTLETLERVAKRRYARRYWPRRGARHDYTTDAERKVILFLMSFAS